MAYIFSIHIPIAGMPLIPVLFDMPLILMPMHIVFLELIIDPTCSIVFEAEKEEHDIMNRPPRSADERLFTTKTLFLCLMQGFVVLGVVLLVYLHSLMSGLGETEVRTMTFITIVLANLLLILTNRSWSETIISTIRTPNKAMGWVFAGTICSLVLILTVPALRDLFRFSLISAEGIVTCVLAAGVSVLWFEAWKLWNVRKKHIPHILSAI